jgi:hypothetical protein
LIVSGIPTLSFITVFGMKNCSLAGKISADGGIEEDRYKESKDK